MVFVVSCWDLTPMASEIAETEAKITEIVNAQAEGPAQKAKREDLEVEETHVKYLNKEKERIEKELGEEIAKIQEDKEKREVIKEVLERVSIDYFHISDVYEIKTWVSPDDHHHANPINDKCQAAIALVTAEVRVERAEKDRIQAIAAIAKADAEIQGSLGWEQAERDKVAAEIVKQKAEKIIASEQAALQEAKQNLAKIENSYKSGN